MTPPRAVKPAAVTKKTTGRGGARNRSGPKPDPKSGRSDARGYSLKALPAEGFKGAPPAFPLPEPTPRELEVWTWAWSTPQACAWSLTSEQWRWRAVAMWCRVSVRCESAEAVASLFAQLHRFADQIGLTTAGLAEMGWAVAEDELAAKAREKAATGGGRKPTTKAAPARRLRAGQGGGSA